jgi:hypothetical protein
MDFKYSAGTRALLFTTTPRTAVSNIETPIGQIIGALRWELSDFDINVMYKRYINI